MSVGQSIARLPERAGPDLSQVVAAHQGQPGALLSTLEELQNSHPDNYLPAATARRVAELMQLPLAQVRSVITFYSFFNLEPQGRHCLTICRGTACHTRGSRALLDALKAALAFPRHGENRTERVSLTTEDRQITLRTVACFGQCALAPVVEVDRVIHGHVNRQALLSAVARLPKEQEGGQP